MIRFHYLTQHLSAALERHIGSAKEIYFAPKRNLTNNVKKSTTKENHELPPSYNFNSKKINPTTLRALVHQLIFPYKSDEKIDQSVEIGSSLKNRISQFYSILHNPGMHEYICRLKQRTISIAEATNPTKKYDYIIVGAGSAGCAVAYRLAASHLQTRKLEGNKQPQAKKVLLVEAGPKDINPWIHIPVGYFKTLHNSKINWRYNVEEETSGLNGRGIAWPRAKVLGGCSSINGLLWVRGIPQDYDNWDEMSGSHGIWSWRNVKGCFLKAEGHVGIDPADLGNKQTVKRKEAFGSKGAICISNTRYKTGLCNAFIEACEKEFPSFLDLEGM